MIPARRRLLRAALGIVAIARGVAAALVGPPARRAFAAPTADRLAAARGRIVAASAARTRAFPLAAPRVVVRKAERALILYDGEAEIARYPIALGLSPVGHKQRQGDNRTPEGSYAVCYRNPASAFHLFLGLNYPNGADARAGRGDGRIDARTARRIEEAIAAKRRPPWETPLGGAVGLHGGGIGSDWTWGCVALENGAIEELWHACPLGTPVEIVPG